jgi:hypothetical protein
MTGLLASGGRVKPDEELAEQFAELLLAIRRQMGPHRRRARRSMRNCQVRGGRGRRARDDMRILRMDRRGA